MPKISMEIKLLEFHVHREPGALNSVWTKLLIQLCTIYVGEKQSLVEDSSISKFQRIFTGTRTLQLPAPEIVPESTYFVCFLLDHLSTTCYVDDHDRYYCKKTFPQFTLDKSCLSQFQTHNFIPDSGRWS